MLYFSDFYTLYLVSLLGSIIAFVKGELLWGIILLIYCIGGGIYFLKYGTINKVLRSFNKGNIKKLKRLLKYIPTEKYFSEEYKGLYYFLQGIVFFHQSKEKEASKFFTKALITGKLPFPYESIAKEIIAKYKNQKNAISNN